ncbi:MAG: PP2C family protein-serine/threonine phosphatase [Tepidisphaeraceae bacterium]
MPKRRTWQEELAIIDRTMKTISSISEPEQLVGAYWSGIGALIPSTGYVALSRRNVEPPFYQITRSSRFSEPLNPWTQQDRLPRLTGGLLGELAYANQPVIIDDLPSRLAPDDPGYFYLQGFQRLVAYPQYDNGQGINVTVMLLKPGEEFDFAMIPILHWQTGLFGRGTHNLVLRNQLESANTALDGELQVVGEIQRSLLPSELPVIPGFQIAAHYQTSARAGGDYYDFFPLKDGSWGIFIADVSGHGTPAAVLMAITHAIAHAHPDTHTPPAALTRYINERLVRAYTRNGKFVTAFYAILDPNARTLTYCRAGHEPPRLIRRGQIIPLDKVGGLPLGILDTQPYEEATLALEPGDLVLLYTDGITEAPANAVLENDRDRFGTDRLDLVLTECGDCDAEQCIARVRTAVASFTGNQPPVDDQTLIGVRCL